MAYRTRRNPSSLMDLLALAAVYFVGYQIGADRDVRAWTPDFVHRIPVLGRPQEGINRPLGQGPLSLPAPQEAASAGPYAESEERSSEGWIEGTIVERS